MKIYESLKDAEQFLSVMMNGRSSKDEDVADTVKKIISDVRENRDEAVDKFPSIVGGEEDGATIITSSFCTSRKSSPLGRY